MIDLRKILSSAELRVGNTLFVAIDGRGGSGKSTLAEFLSQKLNAEIIRTDDFASWENPLEWWPLVIEQIFIPIKNGAKTLSYRRSEWWENHYPEPAVDQPVMPVMIVEGVSSSRREFREYLGLTIFVDAPKELCLQRGVDRDTQTGKRREELTYMWEQWLQAEERYFLRDTPKEFADVVIDGTRPFEEQIQGLESRFDL